jgi:glycosyltransferase involved in cell wall biosynthesis
MHILHALFTQSLGGLEQSYLDTAEALTARGHSVTAMVHPGAPYRVAAGLHAKEILFEQPKGFYDVLAIWRVRGMLWKLRPDLIIAHNARAIGLLRNAAQTTGIPVCGVSHSYKTARTKRARNLVVLTEHMRRHFTARGYPENNITVIPNLIRLPEKYAPRSFGRPPVIGAMGRFTAEKGFDDLIRALHALQCAGMSFKAHIAGEGEQQMALHALAIQLGVDQHIHWEGWVKDKSSFMRKLDIMCVPSREESFGLVVLEAMAHGLPVVATNAPGPASIITSGEDGMLVSRGNIAAIAEALQYMLQHPELARDLSAHGWKRVQDFGFESVADKWDRLVNALARTPG